MRAVFRMNPETLGGKHVFETVVDNFYARILLDEALAPYFAKAPMAELRKHQVDFLSCVIAETAYKGKSMADAHKSMGITEEHFDRVANHLVASLDYGKVDADMKNKLVQAALGLKNEIINK
jgi:hemoglobin